MFRSAAVHLSCLSIDACIGPDCTREGRAASPDDHNDGWQSRYPIRGEVNTHRFALGAVFIYQLAMLNRHQPGLSVNLGLKAFLNYA